MLIHDAGFGQPSAFGGPIAAPGMTRICEVVRVDGQVILDGSQAVLVSNNPYETGDIAGMGRHARLDQGVLGVVSVKIETAAQAAGLLRRTQRSRSVTVLTARYPQPRLGRLR